MPAKTLDEALGAHIPQDAVINLPADLQAQAARIQAVEDALPSKASVSRVETLEGRTNALEDSLDAATSALAGKASASELSEAQEAIADLEEAVSANTDVLAQVTDGMPLGMPFAWPHIILPSKCIWATGVPISRTAYAEFFEISCPLVDAIVTDASTSVSGIASSITDMLPPGAAVEGIGIPSGTTISAVGAGSITLSQAATANAAAIRIFPHGNGDGSNTFGYIALDQRVIGGAKLPGGLNSFIPVGSNPGEFNHNKLGGVGGLAEVFFSGSSDPEDGFGDDKFLVGVNPGYASSQFGDGTGAAFANYPPTVLIPYAIKVLP